MNNEENKRELREQRKNIVRNPDTVIPADKSVSEVSEEEFREPETFLEWQSPEFIYYEKSRRWYFIAVLIFAGLIAYAIFSQSFLMAITFLVAGGIFYLYAQKKPVTLDIAINEDGIMYHDRFFPYEDLKGFWITYEPPEVKVVTFSTKYLLIPKLSIILTDQNPADLRKTLIEELPEDKNLEEGAVDQFARRIKF